MNEKKEAIELIVKEISRISPRGGWSFHIPRKFSDLEEYVSWNLKDHELAIKIEDAEKLIQKIFGERLNSFKKNMRSSLMEPLSEFLDELKEKKVFKKRGDTPWHS